MKAVVLTSLAHDVKADAELFERGAPPADGAVAVVAGLAARLRTVSGDEMLLVVRVDAPEDGGARRAAAVGGGRAGAGLEPDGAVIGSDFCLLVAVFGDLFFEVGCSLFVSAAEMDDRTQY